MRIFYSCSKTRSDDYMEKLSRDSNRSCIKNIALSFNCNFKVQIFFSKSNVSSFVTGFSFVTMFTYLSDQ